jgi:hypothetical protein
MNAKVPTGLMDIHAGEMVRPSKFEMTLFMTIEVLIMIIRSFSSEFI